MNFRLYDESECGKDGYPVEWHRTLKHRVREDAGHRCVRCRHPYRNGEHGTGEWSPCDVLCAHAGPYRYEDIRDHGGPINGRPAEIIDTVVCARWRILTVHHLDGIKTNCMWWNLAALCQRCHLTIQGKVQMTQTYPLEHSEWFKPYAAGWYAWSYLGEALDREETLRRLDELLELERVV